MSRDEPGWDGLKGEENAAGKSYDGMEDDGGGVGSDRHSFSLPFWSLCGAAKQ
jgi:hypothetical protein